MVSSILLALILAYVANGQTDAPTTDAPTRSPSKQPSQAPTPDVENLEYEECVVGENIDGGAVTITLERNVEYEYVRITISGGATAWFAVGMFEIYIYIYIYVCIFEPIYYSIF